MFAVKIANIMNIVTTNFFPIREQLLIVVLFCQAWQSMKPALLSYKRS